MNDLRISRRDFTALSLSYLIGAALPDAPRKVAAVVAAAEARDFPFCWSAMAGGVLVGRQPKTVLQLEPKLGKMPYLLDLNVGSEAAADRQLHWALEEQGRRCSRKAARLTGMLPVDETPDLYAWADGQAPEQGIVIWWTTLNQRATTRMIWPPESLPAFHHPYFLGLVCHVVGESAADQDSEEIAVPVSACLIGRNRLWRPGEP